MAKTKSKSNKTEARALPTMEPGNRKLPKFGKDASHRTEAGTRKFQCNAPAQWERHLAKVLKSIKGKREGEAIRYALAKGLEALGYDVGDQLTLGGE